MKLSKHVRNDLNLAHLVARSGVLKDFNSSFLTQENKNNWLPVHLSKNKAIAEILIKETSLLLPFEKIIIYCIKNNVQSIQTQYGYDLEKYLLEREFTNKEAKIGSSLPTEFDRIELSSYYLSLLDIKYFPLFDFNPIALALSHCNSYFFFALNKSSIGREFINYFSDFNKVIGNDYFIKERAFQVKQQFKQFWNINLEITSEIPFCENEKSSDHLKNLEGA